MSHRARHRQQLARSFLLRRRRAKAHGVFAVPRRRLAERRRAEHALGGLRPVQSRVRERSTSARDGTARRESLSSNDGIPSSLFVSRVLHSRPCRRRRAYRYTITVCYGSMHEWTVRRRYKHFAALHSALRHSVPSQASGTDGQPCFPTQNDRWTYGNQSTLEQRCVGAPLIESRLHPPRYRNCSKTI